jgi:hypothetical protein
MDCKAHRKIRHLDIKLLHFEQHDFDEDLIITAFVDAIKQFCIFQQCDSVSLINADPKYLIQRLQSELKPIGSII